jgi:hypothetical protein
MINIYCKTIKLTDIKTKYKLNLKVAFGRGSRGISTAKTTNNTKSKTKEEGGGNKGIIFEKKFTKDLINFKNNKQITDINTKNAINVIAKTYNLVNSDIQIIPEGGLNKKRPLVFDGNNIYVGGSNFNIGSTVTDITLKVSNPKTETIENVYLSLKWGNTVTFFNAGVQKTLPKDEISKGKIINENGIKILELFGIENSKFCSVFNAYGSGTKISESENTFNNVNKQLLQNLIKSGVGYGYHLVHQLNSGKIIQVKMTEQMLNTSSTPQSCMVYYGGLTGGGKRIDIVVETPMYILKFNIRSKFRNIVFPTHMMCDYVIKH